MFVCGAIYPCLKVFCSGFAYDVFLSYYFWPLLGAFCFCCLSKSKSRVLLVVQARVTKDVQIEFRSGSKQVALEG